MIKYLVALAVGFTAACGGSTGSTDTSAETATPDSSSGDEARPPMPGSDRDEHGCIGSAGYQWCARENACVRSFELAPERGFENSQEAFAAYCSGS